jgi:hypothetical protein
MPKSFDELGKLIEALPFYHIKALRSDTPFVEQAGFPQYCDVLGHGRPGQFEPPSDGSGRHLLLANQIHDPESGLVAQRLNLD